MQFDFMPERRTIDVVFILRRMQEEHHAKGRKLYMCFVNLVNTFDGLPTKVLEWSMKKKGMREALVGSVMSLYEGGKDKILSEFRVLRGT